MDRNHLGQGTALLNPYTANVENMVSPNNASKWQMGFNWAFKMLIGQIVSDTGRSRTKMMEN